MKRRRRIPPQYLLAAFVAGIGCSLIFTGKLQMPRLTTDNVAPPSSVYKAEDRDRLERLISKGAQHHD